jgi:23S rRNA (adenine2030-N6)-methyltransferase
MVRALERLPVQWLNASLTVCKPAADGLGMHGSGMFIVNPPWTLQAELEAALPWLTKKLGQDGHAKFSLTQNRSPSRK